MVEVNFVFAWFGSFRDCAFVGGGTVNGSLGITTEALGKFMEECNSRFSGIDEILEILINEITAGRKQIMDELEAINRKLDD